MPEESKPNPSMPLQGEGDYISAKRYQKEETRFAHEGPVEQKAREAADALDGPEGPELEQARKVSAEGKSLGDKGPGDKGLGDKGVGDKSPKAP